MKLAFTSLLSLLAVFSFAVPGDTTQVLVFDKVLRNGPPNNIDTMIQFPDGSKTYEKILLRYTLTCPTGGCGEWDYTTNVAIQKDSVWYELTRYITPYGKGFPKNWMRTWTMDVTDFAYMLRDSVNVRSLYDGWTQGSLYSLSFDFIEGTPARTTYKIEKIYDGYFTYGNTADPIDDHILEQKLYRDANADLVTMRLVVTGHGSDPNGACEFIDKTHSIWVNSQERYQQHLWRDDCGVNPTYPQTGTFWFPRAGWCPGDLVYPFDYDVTPFTQKNDSFTVDYNMEEYESSSPSGGYNVNGMVFYSSGPNFNLDVAAEDIKQPTSDFRYARTNPMCYGMSPIVVIRNNGKTPLTSCMISYQVDDKPANEFKWTGNLNFLEKAEVALPDVALYFGEPNTQHTFNFRVFYPNNENDEYGQNDHMSVTYTTPKTFSNKIAFSLKTDDAPIENAIRWELVDGSTGNVIEEGGGYGNAEQVRDTFVLATGCYRFTIYDEGLGEGLRPWVYGTGNFTAGSYSLRDDKNAYIVNVSATSNAANFGNRQSTTFSVAAPSDVAHLPKAVTSFTLYPNPAKEKVAVDLAAFDEDQVTITVYDLLGKVILQQPTHAQSESLDISGIPAGSYIMRIESETLKASKQFVIE